MGEKLVKSLRLTTTEEAMDRQEVLEQIIAITRKILVINESVPISEETEIIADLKADSLDFVELIVTFEKEFVIGILDEDAEDIVTVGQAVDLVMTLR